MTRGPLPNPRRLIIRALAQMERNPAAVSQSILRTLLDGPDARSIEDRDRGLITECFYGVLRWRLRLDGLVARHAKKGVPSDPELANILRLGIYQLLFLDRVPAHAAINTAVSLAKKTRGERVARFVNGVLRTIDRERDEPSDLGERWGHPAWMVARFRQEASADESVLEARLRANMTSPPLTLRLHPSEKADAIPGSRPSTHLPHVVVVEKHAAFLRDGIRSGRWLPQDEASARVVHFLDPQPGDRVLELCAGRGVKTTQLADAVGPTGLVVSVDLSPGRLREARRLLARWAPTVPVHFLVADATKTLPLDPTVRFDRILIDAPCTGLGVIRRRPEIVWRRQESDVSVMAGVQHQLIEQACQWLVPGGDVVYSVCTTTPEETTHVVGDRVTDVLQTTPGTDDSDGFYAAKLSL